MEKNLLAVKSFLILLIFVSSPEQAFSADTLTTQLAAKKAAGAKSGNSEVKKEFARATKELKETGIEENSLKAGVKVPAFHIQGKPFKEFLKESPVVLKFYRGSWCPYCRLELGAYQKQYKEFKKKGYQLIFITPDKAAEVRRTMGKNKFSFQMYSDVNNSIAKKFGIAFKLDKKVSKIYKKFGIDLMKAQDNSNDELPLPGTYVIQKNGMITFAWADADYTNRIDPLDLLKKLK
jgi:peroxiredoxin